MYICLQKISLILSAIAEGCPCESVQSGADSTFLTENGYISDGKITDTGFAALEPYRVKRDIHRRWVRLAPRPDNAQHAEAARPRTQRAHHRFSAGRSGRCGHRRGLARARLSR